MIAEIFNSSLISGPETLVLPNLHYLQTPFCLIWLQEERVDAEKNKKVFSYFEKYATVHIIPVNKRRDKKAARALFLKLHELGVTVAHAHDVKAAYILHLSGQTSAYKRIATHHGVHARSTMKILLYEQYFARFILPRFDKTLTVCSTDVPLLEARGLCEKKIVVHLNGVDRELVNWQDRPHLKKEIRSRWDMNLSPGEKVYGILARLAREKDHRLALEVIKRARDLKFKVLCFGVGPEEKNLKKLTQELGLTDVIFWMGYSPTIAGELAGLDGLLSFSRAEGLPINLIEAGWSCTPVFARVVDGVEDLMPSEEFGITFEKEAPLAEIEMKFREFYNSNGEDKARALQKRIETSFSGKSWARQLDAIINDLKK